MWINLMGTYSELDGTHGLLLKMLQAVILALLDDCLHVKAHPDGRGRLPCGSYPGSCDTGGAQAHVGASPVRAAQRQMT
jgi:hypothetical protein